MTGASEFRNTHNFYLAILVVLTLWMSLPGIRSIQVIDSDEARFTQATIQMVENSDYLNIEFQDQARNKKPAGIYWLQAATVKAFTDPGERKVWAHRIVSVFGALLAVLATYWGALVVLGRRGAFWSGAILATSISLVTEAHIAKTDAMLCGLSALCLACLLRLQKMESPRYALIFWIALASAIMIKGPITPAIILLALLAYYFWEKDKSWYSRLISVPGIFIAILMIVPWAIAIGIVTDGAFYSDSLGTDMGAKIMSGQESHGAWPGTYLLTLPVLLWPGVLLLIPSVYFAWKFAGKNAPDSPLKRPIRLLICWILPFWIILEIVPTKLPNYPLPLYPAISILCAGTLLALFSEGTFERTRKFGAVLYGLVTCLLVATVFIFDGLYADSQTIFFWSYPVFIGLAFFTSIAFWQGWLQKALISAAITCMTLVPLAYGHILPRLTQLQISDRIAAELDIKGTGGSDIMSPHFTEPSLVYTLGTDILIGDNARKAIQDGLSIDDIMIIDRLKNDALYDPINLSALVNNEGSDRVLCIEEQAEIRGMNYDKGDPVELAIYRVIECDNLTPRELPDE